MTTYQVKYKKIGDDSFQKLEKVVGDGFVVEAKNSSLRYFMLKDHSRVEIDTKGMIFHFDKDRWVSIKNQMENEAKQKISIKKD